MSEQHKDTAYMMHTYTLHQLKLTACHDKAMCPLLVFSDGGNPKSWASGHQTKPVMVISGDEHPLSTLLPDGGL